MLYDLLHKKSLLNHKITIDIDLDDKRIHFVLHQVSSVGIHLGKFVNLSGDVSPNADGSRNFRFISVEPDDKITLGCCYSSTHLVCKEKQCTNIIIEEKLKPTPIYNRYA